MYVCIYIYTHVYICIYIYIYNFHTDVCVYIYIYIYIYTQSILGLLGDGAPDHGGAPGPAAFPLGGQVIV